MFPSDYRGKLAKYVLFTKIIRSTKIYKKNCVNRACYPKKLNWYLALTRKLRVPIVLTYVRLVSVVSL